MAEPSYTLSVTVSSACTTAPALTANTSLFKLIKEDCPLLIQMYPNPARSEVHFVAVEPGVPNANKPLEAQKSIQYKKFDITLYDSFGRALTHEQTTVGKLRLDTSLYPLGMYYVQVKQGSSTFRYTLSIQD
ncbi:T9SS type A sorting domain-containing protein [Hymenobacter lutimineralis]|uniref:T9SS type A sorting domain-containing protein n=1 Tax=Hymenobacter lutimineralis TaxID=2606448 RepID=A0A5D6V7U9_9BACT|nr:T9SS type A sorting domain-containing protein [Hymenobacter lutimineralis]TYZ11400.1 T9SS type A sorting domain-containing protein [Hymenobacter lutimineralis]